MMIRYTPAFILKQYQLERLAGSFQGYALFFDIADFTPLASKFQIHGRQGAEELSKFLDFVFAESIRIVETGGGFVTHLPEMPLRCLSRCRFTQKVWSVVRSIRQIHL
jgi:hypothetical protein